MEYYFRQRLAQGKRFNIFDVMTDFFHAEGHNADLLHTEQVAQRFKHYPGYVCTHDYETDEWPLSWIPISGIDGENP